MELKHTKGLWLMNSTKKAMAAYPDYYAVTDEAGNLIALLPLPDDNNLAVDFPIKEANFKLVAVSPKLLAAVIKERDLMLSIHKSSFNMTITQKQKFDELNELILDATA